MLNLPVSPPANDVDVLVLSTGTREPEGVGRAIRLLPCVTGVTADPDRSQVLVRYNGGALAAVQIRETVRPSQPQAATVTWLIQLPKLVKVISAASSWL